MRDFCMERNTLDTFDSLTMSSSFVVHLRAASRKFASMTAPLFPENLVQGSTNLGTVGDRQEYCLSNLNVNLNVKMILGMLNSISLLSFTSILMIHLSIVHPQIHWIAGDKKHHHLSLLSDILALQATYLPPLRKTSC